MTPLSSRKLQRLLLATLFAPLLSACDDGKSRNDFPHPVAQDLDVVTDEDTAVSFVLAAVEPGAGVSTFTVVDVPAHGSLTGTAPNLTYTPDTDYNGSDSFEFTVTDNDGASSASALVSLNVSAVNDAPVFTAGSDQSVSEDAGAQSVSGWATAISPGPADESGQTLSFLVSNDDNALFAVQPAVAADGTLTYTPASDASGSATVTVRVQDDGGTADGGVDTSAAQTLTIVIDPVNDAPAFTAGTDQVVDVNAGVQSVSTWATAISPGPADESAQTVSFLVSNDNNTLFAVQPAVAADGTLTYTPANDASGSATVTVRLQDDGGTDNGGTDTSAAQTFTIAVASPASPVGYLSLTGLPASSAGIVHARFEGENLNTTGFDYQWTVTGGWNIASGQGTEEVALIAPAGSGAASVSLRVSDAAGRLATGTLPLSMVGDDLPVLERLYVSSVAPEDALTLEITASDPNALPLTYSWSSEGTTVAGTATDSWSPPVAGRYLVSVEVNNGAQSAAASAEYNFSGTHQWPFFRGARQGLGSLIPQDTRGNTGTAKWQTAFTAADCSASYNYVSAVSQARDGTLYVGSFSDGKLYALDPDSGAVKWSFPTAGSSIWSSPAVAADGTVYIAPHDSDIIYAVNPDGTEKWQYAAGGGLAFVSPAAIGADGTLYIGTAGGSPDQLIAMNPDGTLKWSYGLAGTTNSSVNFGADGTVYARDNSGAFHAIDPADGSAKWPSLSVGGGSGSSPVVAADGTIYFPSFIGSTASRFYAVNPDGDAVTPPTIKWESTLDGYLNYGIGATAAIGTDGTVYVATWENYGGYSGGEKGAVYAVDPADGSVKWRHETNYSVQSSLVVGADGTVYAASKEGIVYALDPASGDEKWTYALRATSIQSNSGSPAVGADGSLYIYHVCEGVLQAIQ